jgi:hypothetical protein
VCLPKFLTLTYSKDELMSNKVRRRSRRTGRRRRWTRRGWWRGVEGHHEKTPASFWSFRFAGSCLRALPFPIHLSLPLPHLCVCVL